MLVWLAVLLPAFAGDSTDAPPVVAEGPPEWDVPVRFRPDSPALDYSRGLPLPRNTRLNPTFRTGGIVLGIGAGVAMTFLGSWTLGNVLRDPFPREGPAPAPAFF